MSSQVYADRLTQAITKTGMVEVVESSYTDNRVTVLFRVKAGVDHRWNDIVRNLLLATEYFKDQTHAWHSHICKTFFLKTFKNEKKLVFGWTISVTSQDIQHALDEVVRVLLGGSPEPTQGNGNIEFEDIPLVGAEQERNAPGTGGKGAHTVGGKADFRAPIRR